MKLTFINQSQPNIRYIINDSSEEFNFPDVDFENWTLYYKKNEYENRLYKIENSKLKEVFQTNNKKFITVIFIDQYKDLIKKSNILNVNYQVSTDDIDVLSSYILLNQTDLSSIINFSTINRFAQLESYYETINDRINGITESFEKFDIIQNQLNYGHTLDYNEFISKYNKLEWMVNELLEDCIVNFTIFNQSTNENVTLNEISLNDEVYNCDISGDICSFLIPTYKLLKNNMIISSNLEKFFPFQKQINKFNYDSIISANHIINFGTIFAVEQLYENINYWVELSYKTVFESDLDLLCFEFDENENLINQIFWRMPGNDNSNLKLISDDSNNESNENSEILFINKFYENHSYLFVIEDFLFNIIQYSSSASEEYPINLSIFLKERGYKLAVQHFRYKQSNSSHWIAAAIYNNEVYSIDRFINETELLNSLLDNSLKISKIIKNQNLKPLQIYS